ncbi:hypothetical protein L6V77_01610 [Myxococcota bacterium]|nr:hypothetical protein [Myxococcota bacterium]
MSAAVVFVVGDGPCSPALSAALAVRGIDARDVRPDVSTVARMCVAVPGLVLLDGTMADADSLAGAIAALGFAVVVRGGSDVAVGRGALRLEPGLEPEDEAHHLADLLRATGEVRRHPRVPWRGDAQLGGLPVRVVDVSPFGIRLRGDVPLGEAECPLVVSLGAGGPEIRLLASPVGRHGEDVALRCRPERDVDLVLWVDLILSSLARSPLHREIDPFGSLFEP